ncbi:MAG: antitoxin MazE-like protein [Lentimonas sp.]
MATKTPCERMKDYRARMRAKGFKQVQMWVYDTESPAFERKLRKQVDSLDSNDEQEALDFIEQVADWPYHDEKK